MHHRSEYRRMVHCNRHFVTLCILLLVNGSAAGQWPSDSSSRWSVDFRYGAATFAQASATLPLAMPVPGRYVELSFLPGGAPEYGVAYAFSRDSNAVFLLGIAFQTNRTTLDVSDSSFHSFQQSEYPVAELRVSQLRGTLQLRAYSDLPFGLGVGMWRAGLGIAYVWGSSVSVLEQARRFPGIQSIASHGSWLLAMDAGIGYCVPGSSMTLTANVAWNLHMEFVPNPDFLVITMAPSSPYRAESSRISPIHVSVGVIIDL